MSDLPVIVVGGGGHAKVVLALLRRLGARIDGIVDSDPAKRGTTLFDVGIIGDDEVVFGRAPGSVMLANGIGSVRQPELRRSVFEKFSARGYRFRVLVHPSAVVEESVAIAEGVQVMAGAVVQPFASIGVNSIVNTGATVDHDCAIGAHVHIAPGATLSGDVAVGDGSHVGVGATLVQGVRVGRACLIRAGAVVIGDVADGATVGGVPARVA